MIGTDPKEFRQSFALLDRILDPKIDYRSDLAIH